MTVFAHSSGTSWDEILLVAVPLVLFAGMLFLARRRADSETADDTVPPDSVGDDVGA